MIYSIYGREACVDLISYNKKMEAVDEFIRWFFPSEEEVKTFKKELVFSFQGIFKCEALAMDDQFELLDEFINSCLSSSEEIREFKRNVAYTEGCSVCKSLISMYSVEQDEGWSCTIFRGAKFKGGKWEQVEKFLTWCFSSEEEISEFEQKRLLEESGKEIHFNLIRANQWGEAETFFA